MRSDDMLRQLAGIQGLLEKTGRLGLGANESDAMRASAAEFILEGLVRASPHQPQRRAGLSCATSASGRAPSRRGPQAHAAPVQLGVPEVRWINYGKFTGDDLGISAEDLLNALAEYLLQSGFGRDTVRILRDELADARTAQGADRASLARRQPVRRPRSAPSNWPNNSPTWKPSRWSKLVDRLAQKLIDEGYVNTGAASGQAGQVAISRAT